MNRTSAQTKGRQGLGFLCLLGWSTLALACVLSPYFQTTGTREEAPGRNDSITPDTMAKKMLIKDVTNYQQGNNTGDVLFSMYDTGTGNIELSDNFQVPLAGIFSENDFNAVAEAAAIAYVAPTYTLTPADLIWATAQPFDLPSYGNPTLTLNSGRQASATRRAAVTVSVEQTAVLSLTGGQTCTARLVYADNSGLSTNVVEIGRAVTTNTGTLAVGLGITNTNCIPVSGNVPGGKYYGVLTTGTGTQTFRSAQETLL